jgi:lambda family phage tail tape measure protein
MSAMTQKSLEIKITADSKQAVASLEQSARALEGLGQKADSVKIRVVDMAKAFALGQAAFQAIGAAVTSIFVSLPKAALEAERLGNAFKVLSGSAAAAAAEQKFVSDEAQRLGISLSDAQEAYLKLAAAARGTSLEGEGARKVFSAVAGAAATLGLSSAETSGALLAISQMMSKGSVQAEELRGQLGERIPGAFQIAARAMGVSTSELSEMLDRGQLLTEDFLPKFAEQLAKEIPGSAETMGSALTRVANTVTQAMQLMGGALADALDKAFGLKDASKSLAQSDGIVEFARKSAKAIAVLMDVVRELVLFVPNVLRTIGGTIAAVARDIKFVFDIAAAVVTEGVGKSGVAAMKRALDERNAFVAAYNQDLADRWFPKNLTERVDEFFAKLRKEQAQAATKAAPYLEASLTAEQRKTLDAIRSSEEKMAAEYKAHASNLYAALTSGAVGIDEYNKARAKLDKWYQEQLAKSRKGKAGNSGVITARLAELKSEAEAEFALLKDSLERQKRQLDAAFEDRLVSIRDYYAKKTAIEQQEIDAEIARRQQELAAQRAVAANPKASEDARLRAQGEVKKLEADLIVLNNRRADVAVDNARKAAAAERDLANELARVRDRLAEIAGGAGGEVTRARLEREYQPLIEGLQGIGDTAGVADVRRLINVESDLAELGKLERQYQAVTERMAIRERELQVQKDAGMLTESQMRREIITLHQQTAAEVEGLIPKMQELADSSGSDEAINRVARLKVEVSGLKTEVDDVATRINGDVENAFVTMFEQIGSGAKTAKEAFRDFARAVIASIQRIAAQKLAEQLFGGSGKGGGGGGIGGFVSSALQFFGLKFATGGPVPGTGTGDTVPAMLTPGEFVVRRDAVQRIGLDMLHAINGGGWMPSISMGRLAFASGGLVPAPAAAAAPTVNANTRIVNMFNIDDAMSEYLNTRAGERAVLNIIQRNPRGLGG